MWCAVCDLTTGVDLSSDDNEFVEWGYGGMGSVKTAAAAGADKKWARVQGSSALGVGAPETGWGKTRRPTVDEDDDGGGMAWLKKRREQRERDRKEAEAKAAQEASEKENHAVQTPHAEVADPDPPKTQEGQEDKAEEPEVVAVKEEPEHIMTAVALPAHHRPMHHHSRSMERVPSGSSHVLKATPERRDSEDTARAVSPPVPAAVPVDAQEMVGEMEVDADAERVGSARSRRESESSTSGTSSFSSEEDEDADVEDSPKDSYGEDDDEESDDDVSGCEYALSRVSLTLCTL